MTSRVRRGDGGSTLLLFPAAMLVVMLLSAIAVDLSRAHEAQIELERAVHAAADDAVALIDIAHLRSTGAVRLDLEAARREVARSIASAELLGRPASPAVVEPGPRTNTITVRASRRVRPLFGAALPGVEDMTVSSSVTAELHVRE